MVATNLLNELLFKCCKCSSGSIGRSAQVMRAIDAGGLPPLRLTDNSEQNVLWLDQL
jgi:hypothetical protein